MGREEQCFLHSHVLVRSAAPNPVNTWSLKWLSRDSLGNCFSIKLKPFNIYREGHGIPLQYSCLETPMGGGAWRAPWGQSMGSQGVDTTERLHFHFSLSCIGEGNGNPLQCSCLENPRDGGAWWAAVSGVAQSRTRLKQLSSRSSSDIYRAFTVYAYANWKRAIGSRFKQN